jgi:HEAT repeat protein
MTDDRIDGLIVALTNFRGRSQAAVELVEIGATAVPPLVEALSRPEMEAARWSILNCLGEIARPEAVSAVAPWLDEPDYQTVAHDALVRIAGRDVGPLREDWLDWSRDEGAAAPAPPAAAVDAAEALPDVLLKRAVEGTRGDWREESQGRFTVNLPVGNAAQKVTVLFGGADHDGSEIVVVYTVCGPAARSKYGSALRLNMRMSYGAVALRDVGGEPHFVMFNSILRHGLTPIELRKSIVAIGERSVAVAKQLQE